MDGLLCYVLHPCCVNYRSQQKTSISCWGFGLELMVLLAFSVESITIGVYIGSRFLLFIRDDLLVVHDPQSTHNLLLVVKVMPSKL